MKAADGGNARGPGGLRWRATAIVTLIIVLLSLTMLAWAKVPDLYPVAIDPQGDAAVRAAREATQSQAIVTTRASVLALLAGLGALVTIAINYRNSQTSARTLATAQETFRVTERDNLTGRYAKAVEQLGNIESEASIAIRLGGVYALQQLAVDTRQDSDQESVVEVLSAFVRLNLRARRHGERRPDTGPVEPSADVLAAISVLAQLPVRVGARMRADFTGLDFTGIDLSRARLARANLARVNLCGARLLGADLRGADLIGADLNDVDLSGADISSAYLAGANLTGARLVGANLRRASLYSAKLPGADLANANLSLGTIASASLLGAKLVNANLTQTNLFDADLTAADLRGARGAVLKGAIGRPAFGPDE